jgi:hypothetical protein
MDQDKLCAVRINLRKLDGYQTLSSGYQNSMEEDIFLLTNASTDWDDDLAERVKKRYLLWQEIAEADNTKVKAFLSIYGLPLWINPGVSNYLNQYYKEVLGIIGDSKQIDEEMQAKIREAHVRYEEWAEEAWRDNQDDKEVSRRVRASLGLD